MMTCYRTSILSSFSSRASPSPRVSSLVRLAAARRLVHLSSPRFEVSEGSRERPDRRGNERDEGSTSEQSCRPSVLMMALDRFIIGQSEAKKAVSVALRNRWRRHKLPLPLRNEVLPKNILLIGPSGSGKTEIARRLAKLTSSPFVKAECTKFTEVGFHGRDVDSIISDLVRVAIAQLKAKRRQVLKEVVTSNVENKILDALTGPGGYRQDFLQLLREKALDQELVEVDLPSKSSGSSDEQNDNGSERMVLQSALRGLQGDNSKIRRKLPIGEARPLLEDAEYDLLTSEQDFKKDAIAAVESDGIVFLDEIDKICSKSNAFKYADASNEGVQRDLLPLLEGSIVHTKQGDVDTAHILFICSGAFHAVKPSDLLAELQGRLPIRVELKQLNENELYRILTETDNNLIKQQQALLEVDGCRLEFTQEALREIARLAAHLNATLENVGARRLHSLVEKLCDEPSFVAGENKNNHFVIDETTVHEKLKTMAYSTDLRRFLL